MSKYSVEEVRARFEAWVSTQPWFIATLGLERSSNSKEYVDPLINSRWQGWQAAFAERIEADERAVAVAWITGLKWSPRQSECVAKLTRLSQPKYGFNTPLFTHPPAQAAQVDDKVIVIRDGKSTTQGLVLAAAIYMGAVKDVFALRPDGPPYNERKVTKDAAALRAFNHLDAATKALRSAISHFEHTAEPVAQGDVVLDGDELAEFAKTIAEFNDCEMTETPQHVLMRWAEMGLLVCEQFEVTKKGMDFLAAAPSPGAV